MVNEVLMMDDIDKRIVTYIQKEPTITHTQLAEKVNRSQPTIGMRIKKLENLGILKFQAGLDPKNLKYYFAKINIQSSDPESIVKTIKSCPYLIRGYKVSGTYNFIIIMFCSEFRNLDKIVNYHFRNNPSVKKVKIEIISEIINDFVIPFDFGINQCDCIEK